MLLNTSGHEIDAKASENIARIKVTEDVEIAFSHSPEDITALIDALKRFGVTDPDLLSYDKWINSHCREQDLTPALHKFGYATAV